VALGAPLHAAARPLMRRFLSWRAVGRCGSAVSEAVRSLTAMSLSHVANCVLFVAACCKLRVVRCRMLHLGSAALCRCGSVGLCGTR
jgi:hypothetical protein